jgi:hypothetical protein
LQPNDSLKPITAGVRRLQSVEGLVQFKLEPGSA